MMLHIMYYSEVKYTRKFALETKRLKSINKVLAQKERGKYCIRCKVYAVCAINNH